MCAALRHALGFPPNVIAFKLQIVGESNFLCTTEDSSSSRLHASRSPTALPSLCCCAMLGTWACGTSAFQDDVLVFPGLWEVARVGVW